jgi:glycosyltransferase involved in cell wall biosynthesis
VHLVAHRLARATGLPWVADYRDPWTRVYHYAATPRAWWARAWDRRLEAHTVSAADVRVTINPVLAMQLGDGSLAGSFHVLPNGFDEEDFAGEPESEPDPRFTLCYAGNLSAHQNPTGLWRAIATLAERDAAFAASFRFLHLGVLEAAIRRDLAAAGLLEFCELRGYVAHSEAVRAMRRAAMLLLVIPAAPGNEAIVTGKVFEYLASGNFVLGIGPPHGAAAGLLAECSGGVMVPHGAEPHEVLREQFARWRRGERWMVDRAAVARYTRRRLTGQLARILDEAATPAGGQGKDGRR